MQPSIFEAGEAVRVLWGEIRNIPISAREGGLLDVAGTMRAVTGRVRSELKLTEADDRALLRKLQEKLLVASESSESRTYAWLNKQNRVTKKIAKYVLSRIGLKETEINSLTNEDKKLASFQTKMFCSQFIAAITQAVLREVNRGLNEDLGTNTIQYFKPITTIKEMEFETMDPNSLEERIQSHYSRGQFPTIVRFLFGKDYGASARAEPRPKRRPQQLPK